jgi:ABC-2 type transport system ATP-binding protein
MSHAAHRPPEPIVVTDGLTKQFDVRVKRGRLRREKRVVDAVRDVAFTVAPGEMVGYLGPNGAGKSTGILAPTSGRIEVDGLVPLRDRVALARRIGVVFGQRSQLWWDLPLAESFELLHHVYRTDRARHRANLDELVTMLDVGDQLATPVRQLSLGQRMKGELVAALLHEPSVLFLDEPTIGLDVVSKHAVRQGLRRLVDDRGVTVLLTTHDLADVEQLCERVVIIDHGRVIYDGGLDALRAAHGRERTLVVDLAEARPALTMERASVVKVEGPRQWIRFDGSVVSAADVLAAVYQQADVRDLSVEETDIDEVVRRIYVGGVEQAPDTRHHNGHDAGGDPAGTMG